MGWVTAIIVYILVWWLVLFTMLPLWVTPTAPDDIGHAAGAPEQPRLWLKAALTSAISLVIWAGIYIVVHEPWFSFRGS
jgi:predicted secreted protein